MSIKLPTISWEVIISNTSVVSGENYRYTCTLSPVNINDPGYGQLEVDYYIVDYIGHIFKIEEVTGYDIKVHDLLEDTQFSGPYNDQNGYVYSSLKEAALVVQAKLNRLDKSAEDFVRSLGLDSETSTEYLVVNTFQTAHGFTNDFIYHNGLNWVKAQANSGETCATHYAIRIDDDNFKLIPVGELDLGSLTDENGDPLVVGEYYFLSQTNAGKITGTKPTDGIIQSVLKSNSTSRITVSIQEPYDINDVGGGTEITSPLTTKGDIWAYGVSDMRFSVGADGYVLSADSNEISGLKWIDPTSSFGTVTSVVAGNGLDFTTITDTGSVILGTPSSITPTSINSVSSTTHTHSIALGGIDGSLLYNNGGSIGDSILKYDDSTNTYYSGTDVVADTRTLITYGDSGHYADLDELIIFDIGNVESGVWNSHLKMGYGFSYGSDYSAFIKNEGYPGGLLIESTGGNIELNANYGMNVYSGGNINITCDTSYNRIYKSTIIEEAHINELYPPLISNDGQPTLENYEMTFWIDTNDNNRTYLMFNNSATTVKIELT